ncbi:MAG: DUF4139 domain-containing protein [Cytophagaceae bacterium]|jgi:uncharacterized protein (TIGR02231 family)|nr:DUF4139 domain-containing protein [Cytophagaceae bacterium]
MFRICSILILLTSVLVSAQVKIDFKLQNVTVFLVGAELHHTAKTNIPKGRTKLLYENISSDIADNSIRVKVNSGLKIIAVTLENVELNYSAEIKQKGDSLVLAEDAILRIDMDKASLDIEKRILTENINRLGQSENVPVAELMNATKLFREKLKELDNIEFNLRRDKLKWLATKESLTMQKSMLLADQSVNLKGIKKRQMVVEVEAPSESAYLIEMSYLVKDAGWSPKYNVRAETDSEKITLEYRAQVYNNSGINWKQVGIALSSSNTETKLLKPELGYAWSLDLRSDAQQLNGVHAQGEGNLSDKQLKNEQVEYVAIDAPELTFYMPLPVTYDILSNNKPHLVSIGDFVLPVEYKYFSVPKIDDDVYLIAYVKNWQKLNLIEGESSVYYNGTFLGNSYINTRYSSESLELSLGIDNQIKLTKVKKQDTESEKTIGTNRVVKLTYQIDVRNNKNIPIALQITDQVPISGDSDIEINVEELSGAGHDVTNGRLVWNLEMKPSEQKSLIVSFTVKFPKSKSQSLNFTLFRFGRQKVVCPKFR